MKSIHKILILCIVPLLVTSCNLWEEIKIGPIDIESHMVLNSMVYADRDTNFFYLTESKAVYRDVDSTLITTTARNGFKLIKDAIVSVKVNDDHHYLDYSEKDSAYILIRRLVGNERISVSAMHNDRKLEASSVLTVMPEILSVDTATVYRNFYNTTRKFLMFKVRIRDRSGQKDYFRLHTKSVCFPGNGFYEYSGYYDTDDPVLINGNLGGVNDSDLGLAFSPGNIYNVFRDRLFQDEEYTLKFYVEYIDYYPWSEDEEEIDRYFNMNVKIESISEELYKYYSTLQYNMYVSDDHVSEAIVVFSNIRGGLGILGTANQVEIFNHDLKID